MERPIFDPAAFDVVVSVHATNNHAHVVALAYNLDEGRQFVGLEFCQLVRTFDNKDVPDPGSKPFSFQQELRLLCRAAVTYRGSRADEAKVMAEKMKEAYGPAAVVTIKPFKP